MTSPALAANPNGADQLSPRRCAHPDGGLSVDLWHPAESAVMLRVLGELDTSTASWLHDIVASWLSSDVDSVVLDLSGLEFLGVAGLELLAHARRRAASRGMSVYVVDGPVCVDRALRAADWTLPTYSSVSDVVVELIDVDCPTQERVSS